MKPEKTSLLGLEELSAKEIKMFLDLAVEFKQVLDSKNKPTKSLKGKDCKSLHGAQYSNQSSF